RDPLVTFRIGAIGSPDPTVRAKIEGFKKTLSGVELLGFVTDESKKPVPPASGVKAASFRLNQWLGDQDTGGMVYAFFAACWMVPWLLFTQSWRPALFACIYMLVCGAFMAATPKAGESIHHVILLWPFPHLLMTVAGWQLSRRFGKPAAAATLAFAAILI